MGENLYEKYPQILLLPPKQMVHQEVHQTGLHSIRFGWPNFHAPQNPLQNKVQTNITLVFANHFCHRKMGFADFFLGGGNSNMFNLHLPIPGKIIQFHSRIFFQMAWRFNSPTSFGVSASSNLP